MVGDVSWHFMNVDLFGSVGDDRHLMIWDLRSTSDKPVQSVIAHENEVKRPLIFHFHSPCSPYEFSLLLSIDSTSVLKND